MFEVVNKLEKYGIKKGTKFNTQKTLIYFAAIATIAGGILHLVMLGPALKPEHFPLQLLPYTDTLFLTSGFIQIFLMVPLLEDWKMRWHIFGICWTLLLTILLIVTRVPNMITGSALIDHNHIASLTEGFQIIYMVIVGILVKYEIS
jgi:hypothetical protein